MENSTALRQTHDVSVERFPAPIGNLLGLTITYDGIGQTTIGFNANGKFANPMGTLHGGVLCDVADAAMGAAFASTLAAGESFTTLELKINFLRPVWVASLKAHARVVNRGKTVGIVECDIVDEQERLVARASSTCMILRGERARGRALPPEARRSESD